MLAEWREVLGYREVVCAFWLAVADTAWRLGRLEDNVRDRALELIRSGEDLTRFDHDPKLSKARRKMLDALADRLASPQRDPVRVRQPFRSVSPVRVGDIFGFALPSGRVAYFRAVGISGDERDNYPTVELLDWFGTDRPTNPGALPMRSARPPRADLLALVRYRRDPNPAERIQVVARSNAGIRRTAPATVIPWTDLEDALARIFGV